MLLWARAEEKKMSKHNWENLEKRGVARRVIESTFQQIALMRMLVDRVGLEEAKGIISEIFKRTDQKLEKKNFPVNLFGIPIRELEACEDGFLSFKEYTKGSLKTAIQDKFHETDFIEDTNDVFSFEIKYCAAHAVAKEYGNPEWCFPWCEIDEVVYPAMGVRLGFGFQRSGALSTGASQCSFRYQRIK
ncbi:MAG: L-2-amino-thiazoline-4-carboxylic acid hydrolase [Chlorobiales bacterium]|nr:L-2-amino-thiazoline-4-carboxylic acid hydrolase [Chlorobiales bacterium]